MNFFVTIVSPTLPNIVHVTPIEYPFYNERGSIIIVQSENINVPKNAPVKNWNPFGAIHLLKQG